MQSYTDGQLTLEKKVEDGKGKCPFDPFQRYASLMFGKYQELTDDRWAGLNNEAESLTSGRK